MDALREQLNKPWVIGLAGFLVGLFFGLVVLGWWLWPVEWVDAGPEQLRTEFKEIYLRMAIDSYTLNPDALRAQQRLQEMGPEAEEILENIAQEPGSQNPAAIQAFQALAAGEPVVEATPLEPTPVAETGGLVRTLLPIMCLLTFLLAGGLVAVFLLQNRARAGGFSVPRRQEPARPQPQPDVADYPGMKEAPLQGQFMTTYNLGNDLYDDSFSIDSQAGEFLGECGVGISETIGVGEPKRVTAFEVWLFDKNDIQTVTKVLMSEHAFADETTRQRLAAKGEPVVAEPGREMVLETATLRLVARVVDMSYGSGALPAESFFERMTLEMVVWSKT
jgi:hypothetical protein